MLGKWLFISNLKEIVLDNGLEDNGLEEEAA